MNKLRIHFIRVAPLALVSLLALSAGHLYAQQTDEPAASPDVTVPMEKQAQLTAAEMTAQATTLIDQMQEALKRIVDLQQVAKRQKDVIKLNCVNDKLLQVKQLLNIAEGARTNLTEAIAQEDEEGRYHEFGKIVIAEQQVRVLAGEAENCIGEELIFIGPTEVDVDEPELPDDPGTDLPGDVIEPPGYASPFQ